MIKSVLLLFTCLFPISLMASDLIEAKELRSKINETARIEPILNDNREVIGARLSNLENLVPAIIALKPREDRANKINEALKRADKFCHLMGYSDLSPDVDQDSFEADSIEEGKEVVDLNSSKRKGTLLKIEKANDLHTTRLALGKFMNDLLQGDSDLSYTSSSFFPTKVFNSIDCVN